MQYCQAIKTTAMEKWITTLERLPSIGKIAALILYVVELFCFAWAQDWFFSKEFTGVWIVAGAAILVYLVYVAWEVANVMIYHWMHGASLIKVLLSPIKILFYGMSFGEYTVLLTL